MKDNMFAETEPAQALREIRARDPNFDMVKFLYHLKIDVPVVIQAYLRGEVDTLKEHCSKDMVERLSGIIAAQQAQVCLCTPDAALLQIAKPLLAATWCSIFNWQLVSARQSTSSNFYAD